MTMQGDRDGQVGGRAAAYGESQPFLEFLTTLLRYTPLIAAISALAGGAAYVLTAPAPPEPVASSQIGLTQQVVWPFYDTARQRAVTIVEDPAFGIELTGRLSAGTLDIAVDSPPSQAFITIEVTAETPEAAVAASNLAAEMLLERTLVRQSSAVEAELATARENLAESEIRIAELDNRLAALVPSEAEAGARVGLTPASQSAREVLLNVQLERGSLSRLRDAELGRQVDTRFAVDQAQARVAAVVPDLEILRRAALPDETVERSVVPVIGATALALIVGTGLALFWDRSRGRLHSRWYAQQVAGVEVLADMTVRNSRERMTGLFLNGLISGTASSGNIVAITGLKGASADRWLAIMAQYLELAGLRIAFVTDAKGDVKSFGTGGIVDWRDLDDSADRAQSLPVGATIHLPPSVMLLDASLIKPVLSDFAKDLDLLLIAGESDPDLAISLADSTVVVATRGVHRVDRLRATARDLRYRKATLLGVVLESRRGSALLLPGQRQANSPRITRSSKLKPQSAA